MAERAPDCATPRAAQIAGVIAAAVMTGEMTVLEPLLPNVVLARLPKGDGPDYGADLLNGYRTAGLMISARARASVRTPSQAALSGAEAALALAEDALDPAVSWNDGEEEPDLYAVLASIRDTLRAGLAPQHAAEGSGPAVT